MEAILEWLRAIPNAVVVWGAAVPAAIRWYWRGRLERSQRRKQHTFDTLHGRSSNDKFLNAQSVVASIIEKGKGFPDLNAKGNEALKSDLVFLLNHYEFLAAGIRNGDISEKLLRDSEQGTIVNLFKTSEKFIESIRTLRNRETVFEHIEWLCNRWEKAPPGEMQVFLEWVWSKPLWDQPFYQNNDFFYRNDDFRAFIFTCVIPVLVALLGRLVS